MAAVPAVRRGVRQMARFTGLFLNFGFSLRYLQRAYERDGLQPDAARTLLDRQRALGRRLAVTLGLLVCAIGTVCSGFPLRSEVHGAAIYLVSAGMFVLAMQTSQGWMPLPGKVLFSFLRRK